VSWEGAIKGEEIIDRRNLRFWTKMGQGRKRFPLYQGEIRDPRKGVPALGKKSEGEMSGRDKGATTIPLGRNFQANVGERKKDKRRITRRKGNERQFVSERKSRFGAGKARARRQTKNMGTLSHRKKGGKQQPEELRVGRGLRVHREHRGGGGG